MNRPVISCRQAEGVYLNMGKTPCCTGSLRQVHHAAQTCPSTARRRQDRLAARQGRALCIRHLVSLQLRGAEDGVGTKLRFPTFKLSERHAGALLSRRACAGQAECSPLV